MFLVFAVALASIACQREADRLQDHQRHLSSLAATTADVGNAWLAGDVPTIYARTALDRTFRLVEQERADLSSRPEWLRDPRTDPLIDDANRSARGIAHLQGDIDSGDRASARRHLDEFVRTARGRT